MLITPSKNLCHLQDRKLAREGLWAHETEVPEVGGLLLARAEAPDLNSDSRLCQLVIFLLEHGPNGSKGVIINRPARASVGDLLEWGYQPSQVSNGRQNPLHVSIDGNAATVESCLFSIVACARLNLSGIIFTKQHKECSVCGAGIFRGGCQDHEAELCRQRVIPWRLLSSK